MGFGKFRHFEFVLFFEFLFSFLDGFLKFLFLVLGQVVILLFELLNAVFENAFEVFVLDETLFLFFEFEFLDDCFCFSLEGGFGLGFGPNRPSPLLTPNRLIILYLLLRPLNRPAYR